MNGYEMTEDTGKIKSPVKSGLGAHQTA